MPLEIRELIIKARIDSEPPPAQPLPPEALRELKEQVLQEALARMEELLAQRAER
jgi:hypothetical protein